MAEHNPQGTGKHPHKSSEDPRSHTKSGGSTETEHGGQAGSHGTSRSDSTEPDNLNSREYRDASGEVHHHTTTYMEQHRGEQRSSTEGGSHTSEKARGSGEHASGHEYGGRRESKEENHRHQEEGAQKRIDELGQKHHQKK